MAYPVKHIQAHKKDTWNVDVSYAKALNARRIAIERIFGTWESNFAELPRYIDELEHTNPDTIERFEHGPQITSQVFTFKFVFWAFGPSIRAFNMCIPIICVNGTHLKGNYKGKFLMEATKNANGRMLHVAFAMVDKESNKSRLWFLHLFRTHVASRNLSDLCVISDHHQGILNVVSQIPGWHHRYCL
ncbi:uncharacterized protein [Rutidosis leptorrhynchoides]|uniref:uncharacterized protein n=1 Tax=Rutidosis leptorrhynchoides TaxID=125765 RepID=UPI003A9A1855